MNEYDKKLMTRIEDKEVYLSFDGDHPRFISLDLSQLGVSAKDNGAINSMLSVAVQQILQIKGINNESSVEST